MQKYYVPNRELYHFRKRRIERGSRGKITKITFFENKYKICSKDIICWNYEGQIFWGVGRHRPTSIRGRSRPEAERYVQPNKRAGTNKGRLEFIRSGLQKKWLEIVWPLLEVARGRSPVIFEPRSLIGLNIRTIDWFPGFSKGKYRIFSAFQIIFHKLRLLYNT